MTTLIYLHVCDEARQPLDQAPPRFVRLGSGSVVGEFHSAEAGTWMLELTAAIDGDVQLVLQIADHPELGLAMRVDEQRKAPLAFRGKIPRCASLTQQVVTRGQQRSQTIVALEIMLARRHEEVIMVTGVDFHGGTNYMAFANTLRDDLYAGTTHVGGVETAIPRVIHDHTIVTFFEFSTGLRIRQIKGQKGWHELDATLLGAVAPVVKMPDTEARQKARLFADTISIMHVYDYITALGHASPGCLRQVHVFSHAWLMGPILLDTNERDAYYEGETLSGPRDPLDKDPRCKDFAGGNIADLPAFCGAPSPDGFFKVWGCLASGVDDYIEAVADAETDTEVWDMPGGSEPMSSLDVKVMIETTEIQLAYLANLRRRTGIGGQGAAPGTTASYQRVGKRHYMFINPDFYEKHLRWYERMFDAKVDPWGYVDYATFP